MSYVVLGRFVSRVAHKRNILGMVTIPSPIDLVFQRRLFSAPISSHGLIHGFAGPGTSVKPDVGKGKAYQVPEFFTYNNYTYFDVEKDMLKDRVQQPKSGLSEFW